MQFEKAGLFLNPLDDLIRVIDQTGPPLTNGPMAPRTRPRVDPTGNREYLAAIVFGGETSRDHRTTTDARFEDHHTK